MIESAYIHIPFCKQICYYCDFNKFFLKGQPVKRYLKALKEEMRITLEAFPTRELKTIFVGGGLPPRWKLTSWKSFAKRSATFFLSKKENLPLKPIRMT